MSIETNSMALTESSTRRSREGLGLPCTTVYITFSHTSGAFPKVDCSTTRRVPTVPTPNDTSWESSRRDVANAELFGTDTSIPAAVEISTIEKIGPGVCVCDIRVVPGTSIR